MEIAPDLYPFTSHYLDIGGQQYHYLDEGTGDPVVMVHGNPTWSFYFRDLIRKLRPRYRCLAPDHIGMGLSGKPDDAAYAYTLEQRVQDLECFLERKSIGRKIKLVLHDWGGPIGMGFACRHPDAIDKIVLMNTAAFHLPGDRRLPLLLRLTRTPPGAFVVRAFNAFSIGATLIGTKRRPLPPAVRKAYRAPYNSWSNRIATIRFVQNIPLKKGDPGYDFITNMESRLALFRQTPVLISWGMKDMVFEQHFLQRWMEILPQAQVHRLDDCGHLLLEDAPEEVGQRILEFLENGHETP